ncbi:MAG: hypothetical protein LBH44_07955 [Treponema sp.]|jgi:hypothetical protein|nr:hypothetical protein [Treponema sp.]
MVPKKTWLFFAAVLISACSSFNLVSTPKSSGTKSSEAQPSKVTPPQPEASMQELLDAGLWISGPRDGLLTIIGVSGRLMRPDDEIEAAKQDAAQKLSMYHGIQGSFEIFNFVGGSFMDYEANSALNINYDRNYGQYIERLSFDPEKDVIRGDGATFIRMKCNVSDLAVNTYSSERKSGKPVWTNDRDLPHFPGYTTVVGFSGSKSRLQDAVFASCESAVARLIESASTTVTTNDSTIMGQASAASMHVRSEGRLSSFQVLEFWIEPGTSAVSKRVYTLAVARVTK